MRRNVLPGRSHDPNARRAATRAKLDRPAWRGPFGVRPPKEARAVVERDRLVLLAEHDPEAKEEPIPPMASRRSLVISSAKRPIKRHKIQAEICSAVAS